MLLLTRFSDGPAATLARRAGDLAATAWTAGRVGAASLTLAAAPALAQVPDTLTERAAVERALAVSPALQTAEAAVALARADRDADHAYLTEAPELDLDAAFEPLAPPSPAT